MLSSCYRMDLSLHRSIAKAERNVFPGQPPRPDSRQRPRCRGRADTIDITPTRPEHVLLVAEIVSPGSETTDRIPVVYAYLLDSASRRYRDGEVFTGLVKATVPFPVDIDLSSSW
jgi:hypothetical protein